MKIVDTPRPEENEEDHIKFGTEVAFNTLVEHIKKDAVIPADLPIMGLMYLPSQAVTEQFIEACAAVVKCLKDEAEKAKQEASADSTGTP